VQSNRWNWRVRKRTVANIRRCRQLLSFPSDMRPNVEGEIFWRVVTTTGLLSLLVFELCRAFLFYQLPNCPIPRLASAVFLLVCGSVLMIWLLWRGEKL